jgi:hypothetical protein
MWYRHQLSRFAEWGKISSTILKIMYNMFSTDYYQLIFLFTFESANMVAKAKQKIGSKTTRKLRFGYSTQSFAGYRHSVWTPSR